MRQTTAGLIVVLTVVVLAAVGCPDTEPRTGVERQLVAGNEGTVCNVMIRKFNDVNGNGALEEGEPEIGTAEFINETGWPVFFRDPEGTEFEGTTPLWCVDAIIPGVWTIWEGAVEGWVPTAVFVNWAPVEEFAEPIEITIGAEITENFEIIFLNTQEDGPPPECNLTIRKFNDLNMNGALDEGEPEITENGGWPVFYSDPLGAETSDFTPSCTLAEMAGTWSVWEGSVEGWVATGALLNGEPVESFTEPIEVAFTEEGGESYEVIFLNALEETPPECNLTIRKFNDLNMNGVLDEGEPEITGNGGWPVFYSDPLGAESSDTAPACILAEIAGTWSVWEGSVEGWVATGAMLNWVPIEDFGAPIEVAFTEGGEETYEIIFLNALEETPPECNLTIRKFNDLNMNGVLDEGEPEITENGGWPVFYRDPNGAEYNAAAPACVVADVPGVWTVWEGEVEGWFITGALVNWAPVDFTAPIEVEFTGECEEAFEVIFLNAVFEEPPTTGSICAHKAYDADKDGYSEGDAPIEGFKLCLQGCDWEGKEVGPICKFTDASGTACWDGLEPGSYVVCEVLPDCTWFPTTPPCVDVELGAGEQKDVFFANYCAQKILMYSKGWWHNKHGCRAVTSNPELLDVLNSLPPFADGFVCTKGNCKDCDGEGDWDDDCDGDDDHDGDDCDRDDHDCDRDDDDDDCDRDDHDCDRDDDDDCDCDDDRDGDHEKPKDDKGNGDHKKPKDKDSDCKKPDNGKKPKHCEGVYLPFDDCGELSDYLVAPNNQPNIGLGQQLAAFTLNVVYATGGLDLYFPKLDMTAQDIIDAAVDAWETGYNVKYWQTLLDHLNNAKVIYSISTEPCPIAYCE